MSQKRPKQTLLDFNFVKKSKTTTLEEEEPSTSTSCNNLKTTETETELEQEHGQTEINLSSHVSVPSIFDVGLYLSKSVDDDIKYNLLNSPWVPETNFNFPKIGMFSTFPFLLG